MRKLVLAVLCSICVLSGLVAQDRPAVLTGSVCDPDGKPLPGVRITLTGRVSAPVEVITAADGRYRIPGVVPDSHYAVAAKLPAFATLVRDGLILRNCGETTELLIARGADVNAPDKEGRRPLHLAAEGYSGETAALLIASGARVNARDEAGRTALHVAAYSNDKDLASLLTAHGADIKAKDKARRTPLPLAQDAGYTGMVELLQKHGARR